MKAPTGVEPVMEVLQTSALPLGYGAEQVRKYSPAMTCAMNGRRPQFGLTAGASTPRDSSNRHD